jgi:hypothetical protein
MVRSLWAAAAIGGLMLGACETGGSTIFGENHYAFYQPGLVNYAAGGGRMPLAVYGQPFGPGTAEQVAAALRMPGGHVQVPFEATPTAQAGEGGRVVLLFDAVGPVSGGDGLCRLPEGRTQTVSQASSMLQVMAAFCHGDGLASEIKMVTARPDSADDPHFRHDMQIMLARLLPTRDPNDEGEPPSPLPGG